MASTDGRGGEATISNDLCPEEKKLRKGALSNVTHGVYLLDPS